MRRIATTLRAAGALAGLAMTGSASAAFGPSGSFGGSGSGLGQFSHPQAVAVDGGSGNIYVADTGNARVQGFNSSGSGASAVNSGTADFSPVDVAVGPGGALYSVSPGRVDGWSIANLHLIGFPTNGHSSGIAVDPSGKIFVSDAQAGKIHVYNSLGVETSSFGTQGSGTGQLLHPMGLTTDAAGNVYVADPDNGRIEKFNSSGGLLGTWSMPIYLGQIQGIVYPRDVAVDSSGRVYAPDSSAGSNVVAVFGSNGSLQQLFGSPDTDPGNPCTLRTPWGVATTGSGGLYVASTGENKLRGFSESASACPAPNFGASPVSGSAGGPGQGQFGSTSFGTAGAHAGKPQIKLLGLPRHCARKNFSFQIQVTDEGVIKSLELFVNGRRAARQQPDQAEWSVKVRMPVQTVRKQLPRGAKVKITVEVKVRDDSGRTANLSRAFKICS